MTQSSNLAMLLHWEDRNSMAHGIEARVPFLDHRLVEFSIGLGDRHKIVGGDTKRVLRAAMRGILPEPVRRRRDKLGFATPEEGWFRGPLRELALGGIEQTLGHFPGLLNERGVRAHAADMIEDAVRSISRCGGSSASASGDGVSPYRADMRIGSETTSMMAKPAQRQLARDTAGTAFLQGTGLRLNALRPAILYLLIVAAALIGVWSLPAKNARLADPQGILANAPGPVSIVRIDDKRFVAANYGRLYAVDTRTATARPIAVRWSIKPTAFVPTGLTYDPSSRTLFIANYTANNLLSGKLDPAIGQLTITEEIGAGTVVSAEGISYDSGRKLLASAQYDGNSVTAFAKTEGGWRLDCLVPVPQAHGVAIDGAYLFATSLESRKLLKINLQRCAVEGSVGDLGWDAKAPEFMWPTTVQRLSDGMIAVSDAHTGHISVIDPESLKVRAWFGSNGPGFGALNMPYGFAETAEGNLLVLSSFGSRLIEFSRSGKVVRSFSAQKAWPDSYQASPEAMLGGTEWRDYANIGRKADLFGHCVVGSYSSLSSCDGKHTIALPLLSDGPLIGNSYYYFTEVADTGKGVLVVSPQNRSALYIAPTATALALIPVPVGFDSWIDGETIARPGGNLPIEALAAKLDDSVRQLVTDIGASGGLAVTEIASRLSAFAKDRSALDPDAGSRKRAAVSGAKRDAAARAILAHFQDSLGQRFVEESTACSRQGCSDERRCLIAAPMAASLLGASTLDIVRLAVASQLNTCLWPTFLASGEEPRPG